MRQFWEFRSYTHLSLGPYSQNDPVRGPYQCWPGMSMLVRLSTRAYTRVWVALTDGQFDVKRTDDTLPRQAFLFPHSPPPKYPYLVRLREF